jgi:hypothetical protein
VPKWLPFDVVLVERDAAFALVLVHSDLEFRHYVRFPGRHADLAIEWPPRIPLDELQMFAVLTAVVAGEQSLPDGLEERSREEERFWSITSYLHRNRRLLWPVGIKPTYEDFQREVRMMVMDAWQALRQAPGFVAALEETKVSLLRHPLVDGEDLLDDVIEIADKNKVNRAMLASLPVFGPFGELVRDGMMPLR